MKMKMKRLVNDWKMELLVLKKYLKRSNKIKSFKILSNVLSRKKAKSIKKMVLKNVDFREEKRPEFLLSSGLKYDIFLRNLVRVKEVQTSKYSVLLF